MRFAEERKMFDTLRTQALPAAMREYERAVGRAIEEYNTTLRENRFICGGIIEHFLYRFLNACGILCEHCGVGATRGDIRLLPSGVLLSSKYLGAGLNKNGTPSLSDVKLINTQGDNVPSWDTATLFTVSHVGIVYGDPSMFEHGDLNRTGGSLDLRASALRKVIKKKSDLYVLGMAIPPRPVLSKTNPPKTASETEAVRILRDINAQYLKP